MIVVNSFAIGKTYQSELDGLIESMRRSSPGSPTIFGRGTLGSNKISVKVFEGPDYQAEQLDVVIPVDKSLINNWNNIGFLKPFWMKQVHKIASKYPWYEETLLWIDADARVRGHIEQIRQYLGDSTLGMVLHHDNWLNGTIAADMSDKSVTNFIDLWWSRCASNMHVDQPDWRLNDQRVLRNMIAAGEVPPIVDLGPRWASIPPELSGSKDSPYLVMPTCENGIIWHWQASRGQVKGWHWPPPNDLRPR